MENIQPCHVPIIEKNNVRMGPLGFTFAGIWDTEMHVCNLKPQHIGTSRRKMHMGVAKFPHYIETTFIQVQAEAIRY